MNFTLLNADIVKELKPSKIADYLLSHGWQEQEKIFDKASIWTKKANSDDNFEIFLPLKPETPDFVKRVVEILETLEVSEKYSCSHILDELTDVNSVAKKFGREVVNFALSFPEKYGSEAPIASMGMILSSLQDTVNGIAQSLAMNNEIERQHTNLAINEKSIQKRIPANLVQEMELSAFGSFRGSFGLKLMSTPTGLLGNELVVDSIKELVELVRVGSEIEGLREHLLKLRSSSAKRYVKFLKHLSNSMAGLHIEWGSTRHDYGGSARLNVETIKETLKVIQEMKTESIETIPLRGRITQGDVKTRHFKFEDNEGLEYVGYISSEAMPLSGILPLNDDCEVIMQEKTVNFFITDKIDKIYEITNLSFQGELQTGQSSLFD